jgi:glycosyltransferase involved in cell wall biosynthesis
VPCFYSEATIQACLSAIIGQKGLFAKEIVLVDSTPTEALKNSIVQQQLPSINYYHSPKQLNPGEARNEGLKKANGEYIAFVDSDVVINPEWTQRMLNKHTEISKNNDRVLLGGALRNAKTTDNYWANTLVMMEFFEVFPSERCERREKIPTMNMFFSATIKQAIHFPATRMAEDIMFCRKFTHAGGKIYFVGDNGVEHITRHRLLKAAYMLGIGSAHFRLSTSNRLKKYLYILQLPIGFAYKYTGILWGLIKYAPKRIGLFVYVTPALIFSLLFYNMGMIQGCVNRLIKSQ